MIAVRDQDSTNGVRINGRRVEAVRLQPGDEMEIAQIRNRLESGPGCAVTLASDRLRSVKSPRSNTDRTPRHLLFSNDPQQR